MRIKPLFSLLLIGYIVFSLIACDSSGSKDVCSDAHKTANEGIFIEATTNDYAALSGETQLLTINLYPNYLSFVEETELPDTFVQYDNIKQFGSFCQFICLSNAKIGDYSHYMYVLKDDSGSEFSLYIERDRAFSADLPQLKILSTANTTNMRDLTTSESGIYICNGINYTYLSGKLHTISWEKNGTKFKIAGDVLKSYPEIASSTAVGQLMNAQDAENVISSISLHSNE